MILVQYLQYYIDECGDGEERQQTGQEDRNEVYVRHVNTYSMPPNDKNNTRTIDTHSTHPLIWNPNKFVYMAVFRLSVSSI